MKNKEKHANEIVEIACKGHDFRVNKNTNEVADCCDAPCAACLFLEMEDCDKARREWAECFWSISEKGINILQGMKTVICLHMKHIQEKWERVGIRTV